MHAAPATSPSGAGAVPLPDLFLRFLAIGFQAWGGPVAQIALMHREFVEKERWVDEVRFRKTLALYQALPGPEAHEMAVWFGHLRRGRMGGFLAGLGFMLPGVVLVTALAALYVRYAATSTLAHELLVGVKPVVVALLALAFVRLARVSLDTLPLLLLGLAATVLGLLVPAVPFLLVLAVAGLVALVLRAGHGQGTRAHAAALPLATLGAAAYPALTLGGLAALALVSLQAGMLSFGGAYTAIPFLYDGAVVTHGWLTQAQFLDAVALSQIVPGPLIAIATFVGYQVAGLPGALVATVLVFAPAFGFTLLGHRHLERLVDEPRLHAFLLGVTAAVVGLILVATVPLARGALVNAWTVALALGAGLVLHKRWLPIPVVVGLGALAGLGFAGGRL